MAFLPEAMCASIIWLKSIRYTWSAPTTTTMSGCSSPMRFRDWKIASALPRYQRLPRRCCAGTDATYEFSRPERRQVSATWRSRLCDLYWVSTTIWVRPEFSRFDRAKSIKRYTPPNGTAGFARSSVSGMSRLPSPPASTMPNIFFDGMALTVLPRDIRVT